MVVPATELVVASGGPFPTFARPSADECYEVRNRLMDLHGLDQYVRPTSCPTNVPIDSCDPPEVCSVYHNQSSMRSCTVALLVNSYSFLSVLQSLDLITSS